ncbi:ATP-binding cassette domain-containing protein [Streptomyces sp. NPDC050636]|uniref:ABC transporter ATP-binding protein n=1 Tax=Streptomyces sp. NPDC050636 TaxID=3154510 RepID=UPI003415585B
MRIDVAGHRILHDISLAARAGAVTALVGASGSGKTTTGLALMGECPPGARVEGQVRVTDGGPVGYIPQHPAAVLNPSRRVGALLYDIARSQLPRLPRRERRPAARARVLEALAQAQLPEGAEGGALLRRYPHQLSGGQQQRVVLAQALLLGAQVIVADEPTTGQDALTKRRIVAELDRVARQGIALVLLSHDLDVVRELADEVVVLRDGRIVESGPADQVLGTPKHPWTRELLTPAAPSSPDGTTRSHEPAAGTAHISITAARYPSHSSARGTATALRDVELNVPPGACLAIVGRSGSGKTTLGRCVAGLHRDWDGELTLDGTALPSSIRARTTPQVAAVQYVFQDARTAFDEHRTVLAQTARTAIRLRGVPADKALEEARTAFARVGLGAELHDRLPGRLSGGELQRAALARALLAQPRVLVCDEITSGLDAVSRRGIVELLAGLLREPSAPSLLLITHDLDTAEALADEIAVLDGGRVVETGPAGRVLTTPAHPFTTSLVAAAQWGTGSPTRPSRTASV